MTSVDEKESVLEDEAPPKDVVTETHGRHYLSKVGDFAQAARGDPGKQRHKRPSSLSKPLCPRNSSSLSSVIWGITLLQEWERTHAATGDEGAAER